MLNKIYEYYQEKIVSFINKYNDKNYRYISLLKYNFALGSKKNNINFLEQFVNKKLLHFNEFILKKKLKLLEELFKNPINIDKNLIYDIFKIESQLLNN